MYDTMVMATLIKEKIFNWLAYIFSSVHCHHGVSWWQAHRYGAGEVAKRPLSYLVGNRK